MSSISLGRIPMCIPPWVSRSKVVGSRKFLFCRFNFVATNHFAELLCFKFFELDCQFFATWQLAWYRLAGNVCRDRVHFRNVHYPLDMKG